MIQASNMRDQVVVEIQFLQAWADVIGELDAGYLVLAETEPLDKAVVNAWLCGSSNWAYLDIGKAIEP